MGKTGTIHTKSLSRYTTEIKPIIYLAIFLFAWIMTSILVQWDDYDIHRNYEEAIGYAKKYSLFQMIRFLISEQGDFIYYVILYCAIKLSIPLNFVTALMVTTYYVLIVSGIKELYKGRIGWNVFVACMFATPFIWVISISRNMTAIMFLFLGVRAYYRKNWFQTILFLAMGVFSHFSVLMYVAFFAIAFFLKRFHLNVYVTFLIIIGFYALSFMVPTLVFDLVTQFVSEHSDYRYGRFALVEAGSVLEGDNTLGEYLSVFFTLGFSAVLLVFNKRQDFEFWALFMLMICAAFFMNSNITFLNRCMMVMPMFLGLNVARVFQEGTAKQRSWINKLSYVGVLIILMCLYTFRVVLL